MTSTKKEAHLYETDAQSPLSQRTHSQAYFNRRDWRQHEDDMTVGSWFYDSDNKANKKRRDHLLFMIYFLDAVAAWFMIIAGGVMNTAWLTIFGCVLQIATIVHATYEYGGCR